MTDSVRDKLARSSEDALGKLAQDLLENPLVNGAISRAFEAREKAVQAQEATMGALGIPSAADVERLTRRLRSVSQRLEGIEDGVDRLDDRLASIDGQLSSAASGSSSGGNEEIAERPDEIARDLAALREAVAPGAEPPPRAQERLSVSGDSAA